MSRFIDDCSCYRVASGAYLHKEAKEAVGSLRRALRKGRMLREIYIDNARQFIAKEFKDEAKGHGIKLIFGRAYHPRGQDRGISQGTVEGFDNTDQVLVLSIFQRGAELRYSNY